MSGEMSPSLARVQTISRIVTVPIEVRDESVSGRRRTPRALWYTHSVFLGSLFRSGTTSWRGGGPHCTTSSRRLSFACKGREKQHRQRSKVVTKQNDQAPTDLLFLSFLLFPFSSARFVSLLSFSLQETVTSGIPPASYYASISPNLTLCSGVCLRLRVFVGIVDSLSTEKILLCHTVEFIFSLFFGTMTDWNNFGKIATRDEFCEILVNNFEGTVYLISALALCERSREFCSVLYLIFKLTFTVQRLEEF